MLQHPVQLPVFRLGNINAAEIENALGTANNCQSGFYFSYLKPLECDLSQYTLPNGGFDFDRAAVDALNKAQPTKPTTPSIVLTSEPYGSQDHGSEAEYFYFMGWMPPNISIISTYLWSGPTAVKPLQDYLLFMLGTALLAQYADLTFHYKTKGCAFDYCDETTDIAEALSVGRLCKDCERDLDASLSSGRINLAQCAASLRLMHKARGTKRCFVVMPFQTDLDRVYKRAIRPALSRLGWEVVRADEMAWPRIITRAIILNILAADLIVAELTGTNPNVLYEVGVADAVGADIFFLACEGQKLPFDVNQRRTVFYRPNSYKALSDEIERLAGSGLY